MTNTNEHTRRFFALNQFAHGLLAGGGAAAWIAGGSDDAEAAGLGE